MVGKTHKIRFIWGLLVILGIVLGVAYYWHDQPGSGYEVEVGFSAVEQAFHERRTEFMSEVSGTVTRVLTIDRNNPGTQKFVMRLENGQSLLVIHDRVAAGEVPISIGDPVKVRGKYTWSETGGILQNTQHDPSIERRHGWVEHKGKRYQ